MKKFIEEFREFIARGNAMDMAVGVIIGGAFTAIVTSLTDDLLNPFIKLVTGGNEADVAGLTIPVAGTENGIDFGAFISAVINFLIIALVVFLLIKALNGLQDAGKKLSKKKGVEEVKMDPPVCPFCLEEVKEGATRCPHCAAAFEEPAVSTPAK